MTKTTRTRPQALRPLGAVALATLALSACNFHNAGTVTGPTADQGWSLDLDPFGAETGLSFAPEIGQEDDPSQ